jgi:hypothetical protein
MYTVTKRITVLMAMGLMTAQLHAATGEPDPAGAASSAVPPAPAVAVESQLSSAVRVVEAMVDASRFPEMVQYHAGEPAEDTAMDYIDVPASFGSVSNSSLEAVRVPSIAEGYHTEYRALLAGRREYRPEPRSDAGLVTLSIGDLLRPLAGTANPLDAGQYISISIGYTEGTIPANAGKTEKWVRPKFLEERWN